MNKTFNLYCDESTHLQNDGQPYMIISYVGCPYNQLKHHKQNIKLLRAKHKFGGEIKWSSISGSQYHFYNDLVEYFFSGELAFRAVIVDKNQIDENRPEFTYGDFYFRMYYQLLHHKIDLENNYNIYLDVKDTISDKKLTRLKDMLRHNASLRSFQFIKSHESSLMQIADLLMGAINYKLRGLNKVTAKNKIVEKIEAYCKKPINRATSKSEQKFNLFYIDLK